MSEDVNSFEYHLLLTNRQVTSLCKKNYQRLCRGYFRLKLSAMSQHYPQ